MTEKIKLLAEQAGLGQERWTTTEQFNSFLDKFGELIVQECIDCAKWVGRMNTTAVEPVNTAHAIVKRIEKHFGGEE